MLAGASMTSATHTRCAVRFAAAFSLAFFDPPLHFLRPPSDLAATAPKKGGLDARTQRSEEPDVPEQTETKLNKPRSARPHMRFTPASGMMYAPMTQTHPLKLRLREIAFILLGVSTCAGLSVLWFGMVPELMDRKSIDPASFDGAAAMVTHMGFQLFVLFAAICLLAAGTATRLAMGRDRAIWFLAGGCVLAFVTLVLTVEVLYEPLLATG
jgi:hypothetical protein